MAWLVAAIAAPAQSVTLSLAETTAPGGQTVSIPVNLDNTADITAVQFKLTLADGLTADPEGITLTDRTAAHDATMRQTGYNTYMVMLFSATNAPVTGRTGAILNIPIQIVSAMSEGDTLPITLSEVVIAGNDGSNLATGYTSGSITVMQSPDFAVGDISFSPTEIMPGGELTLSWTVSNVGGAPTADGWNEQITLIDENGNTAYLGTLYDDSILGAGAVNSRSITVTLPATLGLEGETKVAIKLTPNRNSGEPVSLGANNQATSEGSLSIGKQLILSPAYAYLPESDTRQARFMISRSGSTTHNLVCTIEATADSRLSIPQQVTIPARSSSVYFYVTLTPNGVIDDNSRVEFTVSGEGYPAVGGAIEIEDDTYPTLTLATERDDLAEGDNLVLTVTAQRAVTEDLEVKLSCDHPKRFTLPSAIVIPAGQTSVTVTIPTVDDNIPELDEFVTFTATAARHTSGTLIVGLTDNDMPSLALTLTPDAVSEAAGPLAVTARLQRLDNFDSNITVRISDDSEGALYLGRSTVEMAPGVREVTFNLGPVDNDRVDGERTYQLTAAVYIASCSCNAQQGESAGAVAATLTVYDNDGPTLSLSSTRSVMTEGSDMDVTVSRNTATDEALTVTLTNDHPDDLEMPTSVTIPAGAASVTFTVQSKGNDITDDSFDAAITAEAEGFSKASLWFSVSDQTLPDARITAFELSASESEAGATVTATLTLENAGSYPLPEQTKVGFYLSSSNTPAATAYLQAPLAPGSSIELSREITLPSTLGGYGIYAVANDGNAVKELLTTNNTSQIARVTVVAPYRASLSTDKDVYAQGEPVTITGHLNGSATDGRKVEIYVINDGYRHTIEATTDASGAFSAPYTPFDGQMGIFNAGACYPGEGLTEPMASFEVTGLRRTSNSAVTAQLSTGEPSEVTFDITNPCGRELTGMTARLLSVPDNCTASVECPSSIAPGARVAVKVKLAASSASPGSDWQQIPYEITTSEGATVSGVIYYFCRNLTGQLKASVSRIATTMIKGATRDYPFTITNTGRGATGKITVEIPSWMSMATPREIASLEQGDSASVILRFTPTDAMQLNVPVTGNLAINCTNGDGLSLPFSIEPVSETEGTLTIDVCDENTYYTAEAPHVEGASVTVTHPTTGATVATGTTDADGLFSVKLPEGYYAVSVTAPSHTSYRNNILVDPGTGTRVTVNLSFDPITVDWKVEETTVEDEYEIVTTVNYETSVPVPVVELNVPSRIEAKSLAEGESLIFYATLTNKGLITAQDVQLLLPEGFTALTFEALAFTEPFTLAPQQSVLIPVKVTHKPSSQSGALRAHSIDNDPCIGQPGTLYYWDCGTDRKWHRYAIALQLGSCDSNDPSTWGGGSGSGSGGGGWGGGGWGSGGPGGTGVIGPTTYYPSTDNNNVGTTDVDDCEPCQNQFLLKLLKCGAGFVPGLGNVIAAADCANSVRKGDYTAKTALTCVSAGPVPYPASAVLNAGLCLWDFLEPCDMYPDTSQRRAKAANGYPDYVVEFQGKVGIVTRQIEAYNSMLLEIFGSDVWYADDIDGKAVTDLIDAIDATDGPLNAEALAPYKPESVSTAEFNALINRINGNAIDIDKVQEYAAIILGCEAESALMGYESTGEMYTAAYNECYDRLQEARGSVCASITLRFTQSMVMTRQAFRGTLSVFNGNETTAMTDVKLELTVTDEDGNVATSHEFQINPESLDGFDGQLSFNAGWTLGAKETGVATVLFIPTKYAAPTADKVYRFGGALTYTDPFSGLTVTRDLTPVALTVKPSPDLNLTYFMQRDIIGDDPLTEAVEPCEEAEFSLLIHNVGYGDATDVRMVTNQPEIIDNEKGLAIEFELISSQLNGGDKSLALGGSVATEFGTIPAGSTAYAQWWIKSSLLGHFTSYNVEANHISSYGNPDLSLLNEVTIHELIRSFETGEGDSRMAAFLTNDIPDADDTPDMVYFSNGQSEAVNACQYASIEKISATEYRLTVSPALPGWTYGHIADPTYGMSELRSVVRASDGTSLNARNFWLTDRTLRDGKDPLYENNLHFIDELTATETYLLTFDPTPELMLEVAAIEGQPDESEVVFEPVDEIRVMFNKHIDPATFTADDVTLAVQGRKLDLADLTIATDDNKTFTLGLAKINETIPSGYNVLTVATAELTDTEGFNGKNGKSAAWIMFRDGLVSLTTAAYPENAGQVEIVTEPAEDAPAARRAARLNAPESVDYGSTVTLGTSAAEGYEFAGWELDGEVVSTESTYTYTATHELDITARFTRKSYEVTVEIVGEGTVDGSAAGSYFHGDKLSFKAVPAEDYAFSHWSIGESTASLTPEIEFTVTSPIAVEANFEREIFEHRLSLASGWNWMSHYVNTAIPVSELAGKVAAIKGIEGQASVAANGTVEGDFDMLQPGNSYKVKALNPFVKAVKGKLMGIETASVTLGTTLSWIGYPFSESSSPAEAITNAEDGDAIIGHSGFAVYNLGTWEGTLGALTPGEGYMYHTAAPRQLTLELAGTPDYSVAYSTDVAPADHPDNMNFVCDICDSDSHLPLNGTYAIRAFVGDEQRGEGVGLSDHVYMTVHGTEDELVTFSLLNLDTDEIVECHAALPLVSGLHGNRTAPYRFYTDGQVSGFASPVTDTTVTVCTIDGIVLMKDADPAELKNLAPGFYIINNRTTYIK